MNLNSEDTDVREINKENAEGGINIRALRVRMVWKRHSLGLGTRDQRNFLKLCSYEGHYV